MNPLYFLANFASGFFVCYALPHLVSGLQGRPYRNPFGQESPWANFLWGTLSLAIGFWLMAGFRFYFDLNLSTLLFWLAFILTGLWLTRRRQT